MMSLVKAVRKAGQLPAEDATQAQKKRYSELLSAALAQEVAEGLRGVGFPSVKPAAGGPGEKAFQGGLGPKKVDVSYSDERHGLLLAVSIKTICAPPFGKNLKNRFSDLCTEAITLHLRFPYAVVCALFAFPADADRDLTQGRAVSTFRRATKLFATIGGREQYTDPGEKFENLTMLLFDPYTSEDISPNLTLVDAMSGSEVSEQDYFLRLREIFSRRNPHAAIGETPDDDEDE
jgi:hypothetical protein